MNEEQKWEALLDKVRNLSPEFVEKFRAQERFRFLWHQVSLGTSEQKDRYCTVEGLIQQRKEFDMPVGLVYYLDESVNGMNKQSFERFK